MFYKWCITAVHLQYYNLLQFWRQTLELIRLCSVNVKINCSSLKSSMELVQWFNTNCLDLKGATSCRSEMWVLKHKPKWHNEKHITDIVPIQRPSLFSSTIISSPPIHLRHICTPGTWSRVTQRLASCQATYCTDLQIDGCHKDDVTTNFIWIVLDTRKTGLVPYWDKAHTGRSLKEDLNFSLCFIM